MQSNGLTLAANPHRKRAFSSPAPLTPRLTAGKPQRHKAASCLNRFATSSMRSYELRHWPRSALLLCVVALAAFFLQSAPASADLRLCNKTPSRVGVAIGYKDKKVWTTEGWWNVPVNSCETLVSGTLVSRYYYVYAVDYDHGGEWSGKYVMCTKDKMFTIEGTEDCVPRGFNRSGFFEVDTGEQTSWTIQLNEPAQQGAQRK
ncbi:DUF1036 domain-containing protein [Kaistia terrae]|jgi:uncharacterized membrane protein|uniref:DUF1036 domain-containing protein n=1 Tax=Kaistia terrae TaxID=537017 RepID=A0ABW0PPK7_9HYPH|nr:DUF1036 domain-containing protein [Kaistia terrae]